MAEDSGTAVPDPQQWISDALAEHPGVDPRRIMVGRWFGLLPAHPRLAGLTGALDAADRAAGVIRVRVDDATEAVHIAICEDSIEDCLEYRGRCVKAVEALVTP